MNQKKKKKKHSIGERRLSERVKFSCLVVCIHSHMPYLFGMKQNFSARRRIRFSWRSASLIVSPIVLLKSEK